MTVGEAFEVLAMPPTDDLHAINVRYRALAKRDHPDRAPRDDRAQRAANERMARLNAANDVLICESANGSLVTLASGPPDTGAGPTQEQADPWAAAPWSDEVRRPPPPPAAPPPTRPQPPPPPSPPRRSGRRVPRPRTVAAYWRCRRSYARWLGVTAGLAAVALVALWVGWPAADEVLRPDEDVVSGRAASENYTFDLTLGVLFTVNSLRLVKRMALAVRAWRAGIRPTPRGGARLVFTELAGLAFLCAGLAVHAGTGAGDQSAPVALGHGLMAVAAALVLVACITALRRIRHGGVYRR